jgi:uncharacterized coiled-coil protein SlyX
MAEASDRLLKLRPVQFRYKTADASGEKPIQYGLIAEEVAEVYPELVVRDATTSRIDGVRYDELAPMLLNEVQKITERVEGNEALEKQIAVQAAEIRDLKQQVTELKDLKQQMAVMSAALQKLQPKEVLLVQR